MNQRPLIPAPIFTPIRRAPLHALASAMLFINACVPCVAQPPEFTPVPAPASIPVDKSLVEIHERFAGEQARALESYLAANPNAHDAAKGLRELYYCYLVTEDKVRQLATLEREYAFLAKGPDSDLKAIGETLNSILNHLTDSNKSADAVKAKAMIQKARKELAGHPDAQGTSDLFTSLEGKLNRPVVGGTLEIAFTALDGTKVDLASMKGKVVLVDFWATWCAPCVASQPGIKAAYDKFHEQGFEVIGISLDNAGKTAEVEKFLKTRNLPWPQSYDGKCWETPLVVKYGIGAIPASFLIGKDGRIVAVNPVEEELESALGKLLK